MLVIFAVILIPVIISRFLTTVDAGTIRLVSRFGGSTSIYKGPGKAIEVPLMTTSTTIPSKAINIDLDIADQTADVDRNGVPKPIKVRVLASAIVSVGDSNEMITTAANKFFSKPQAEQTATLSDLLTSTGRRAVNLLNHDELFSSKAQRDVSTLAPGSDVARSIAAVPVEEDDRLALIIKGACSRELQDLGLVFNSLNIKEVQSEVAEARRRQSAVEAKANADIVSADQERRAREAQLGRGAGDQRQAAGFGAAQGAERRHGRRGRGQKADRPGHPARGRTEGDPDRPGQRRRRPCPHPGRSRRRCRGGQSPHTGSGPGRRHPRRQRGDPAGRRCLSGPEADWNCCRRSSRPSPKRWRTPS